MQDYLNRPALPGVARTLVLIVAAVVLCSGCQTSKPQNAPTAAAANATPPAEVPLVLAEGDVVRLTFPGAPEISQTQKIRADGRISLPMVGEIRAAGKRPLELQAELKTLFAAHLTNSEVVVTVESGAVPVFLSGAVRKTGRMVYDRPTNLLEVITDAGGFTPQANLRKIQVIRLVNGQHQSQVVDLKPTLSGKTTKPFYVRPNDVIHVSENFLNF